MADIEKSFKKQWEDFDKLYLNSKRFSTTEFAGIFLIFIAGEAGESFVGYIKKGVENSKK
jgi:hypothetical protein